MQLFFCQNCGNAVHFENDLCLNCGLRLGFLEDRFEMATLESDGSFWTTRLPETTRYKDCRNAAEAVCNWVLPAESPHDYCEACRHNLTIPDLSVPQNRLLWHRIELAKRYVFRSLLRWELPMPTKIEDPEGGLAFAFLSDVEKPDGTVEMVKTGHDNGLITINIAEADDAERERRRIMMGESYRTLVGHFRHELAHYFWDRLVRATDRLDECRALFGDERADYGEALKRHYEGGPASGWQDSFITAYATSHPWEDFAETWAHYVHMVDALETARSYGIAVRHPGHTEAEVDPIRFEPYHAANAAMLVEAWVPLTVAVNGLNRSMGQPDLYPFVLSRPVVEKLEFVHRLIHDRPVAAGMISGGEPLAASAA